jgi:putative SOS response-associated peptidase YedK
MCGRYYLADVKNMRDRFGVKDIMEWLTSRYNIAPSQEVPAIIDDTCGRAKAGEV